MSERIAGNQSTGLLKWIALVCMCCDHAGKMLFPGIIEMRIIGRIAYPLYCWCMVVGICRTKSIPWYLARILITGAISQPLYVIALDHQWNEPNIFLTLAIGLAGLWGIREKKWGSQWWAPIASLFLAVICQANYGMQGVLLVFLLYMVRESRVGIAAVMIAFCLGWGANTRMITSVFGVRLDALYTGVLGGVLSPWLKLQALAILSLPLMIIPFRHTLRMPKLLGYILYPAHLGLLYLAEQLV